MKRKTIELKEFEYKSQYGLDRLYNLQDRPFVIETNFEEVITVTLKWEQGHSNNYRFVDQYGNITMPGDVSFIEFIPEWGML